jgi:hypothetical protein
MTNLAVLDLGEHVQPVFGALTAVVGPPPPDAPGTVLFAGAIVLGALVPGGPNKRAAMVIHQRAR